MPTYDATAAECLIYTFKEGFLSRLAHDLKLGVTSLSVTVDTEPLAVRASFETRSVQVLCFRRDGRDDPTPLGALERSQIESNLHTDVLGSARFPTAQFVSTSITPSSDGFVVRGALTLHGRTAEITAPVRRVADRYVASVTLRQTAFGIKPYSAALGSLKVRDELTVTLSVPAGVGP